MYNVQCRAGELRRFVDGVLEPYLYGECGFDSRRD
jgi:hypothetical protein